MSIQIIENKSEIGAGTRGASLGIDALKIASYNLQSDYFRNYNSQQIEDQNLLLQETNQTPNAIHIDGIFEVFKTISTAVENSLKAGDFPLVLAADHASAGGTIAGIKKQYPEKRLGVIWIDAHADLHSPYTSPSGNVHGMPLATALNEDNQENKINEVSEETHEKWEKLKQLYGIAPKINYEDIVFFGVRDTEAPEDALIAKHHVKNYTIDECRRLGFKTSAQEALDRLANCDIIYVSFDVDSMDCDKVSYGTGTPVPNGYMPFEVNTILKTLLASPKVCCFEVVEINPTLDKVNKMADTAFGILEEVTEVIKSRI